MRPSFASVGTSSGDIKLRMVGQGQPVICLHGWPQNHREWIPVTDAFNDLEYQFILPDLPGFGSSYKPLNGYSADEIAALIGEVADALKISEFHLVAHDIGGPIAVALAFQRPDKVSTLTLLETPLWGISSPGVPDLRAEFWHIRMHGDLDLAMALLQGKEDVYLKHFFNSYSAHHSPLTPTETDSYIHAMQQPGALRGGLMHYVDIPESETQIRKHQQSGKISVPILALGGSTVMGEYCFQAAQLIGDQVYGGVVENCGHWIPEEAPERLSEMLREHWKRGEVTNPATSLRNRNNARKGERNG